MTKKLYSDVLEENRVTQVINIFYDKENYYITAKKKNAFESEGFYLKNEKYSISFQRKKKGERKEQEQQRGSLWKIFFPSKSNPNIVLFKHFV